MGVALDQDAAAGAAVLAGVVEEGAGGGRGGRFEVGVGEDDVGALAAEFEGHRLHPLGALGHDLSADGGGAGEDDLGNAGVADEGGARDGPGPGQDLEEPFGEPGLQGEFGQPECGERGGLGGFEEDGVARGERGGGAPGGDRHGEVPRGDDGDDAERFVEGDVQPAGHGDLRAGQPLRPAGRVVEEVPYVAGLPPGVADGVAGLLDLQAGQLFEVRVHGRGEAAQLPGAVAGGEGRPGVLRAVGAYDGGFDVLGGGGEDGGDDLFGGGVEYLVLVHVVGFPHMRSKERNRSQSVTAVS